jgi:hypothetical protein
MIGYLTDKYFRLVKVNKRIVLKMSLFYSRRQALKYRKDFRKRGGKSVLTRQVKKEIKQYCKERFGSAAYWPHVAFFTETRGEFIRGMIPEDYFTYVLEPRFNPLKYSNLGDMRTRDHKRFGEFAIKPLLLFISGNFYNADFEVVDEGKLKEILRDYDDTIVVKQEFGWGGKQVRVIHSSEFSPEQLLKGENYIIQPFLKQYKPLNELYPHSVNTIRVITFLKKNGTIEVLYTMLRFGVDGIKVDNLSSGGQCLYIDPSGKPAESAVDFYGLKAGEQHKNTGYRFADIELPMLPRIKEKCISSHEKYPYVRMIGWDICVDESGEPKLIEWNTQSPSYAWEDALFGPFLTDDLELQ